MKRCGIYARVSTTTKGQDPQVQLLDLKNFVKQRGWCVVGEFIDVGISGTKDSRPELNRLMELARKRKLDVVLCWRFDRFARSTSHLLRSLEEFKHLGIDFCSYQENLDTSTPLGQAMFTIVSAVAQLERDILIERVQAGLRKARSIGKRIGRPRSPVDTKKLLELKAKGLPVRSIGKLLGISSATVSRTCKVLQKPPRILTI
jgi:DNA invertase Pin-like site-specific DNA recombinase